MQHSIEYPQTTEARHAFNKRSEHYSPISESFFTFYPSFLCQSYSSVLASYIHIICINFWL